eukprot:gene2710-3486_t
MPAGGEGIVVGDEFWEWGSTGNCWKYADTEFQTEDQVVGVDGIPMTIIEQEITHLRGRFAHELNYTAITPEIHTELTVYNPRTNVTEDLLSPAPHKMASGEVYNTTVFVRVPTVFNDTLLLTLRVDIRDKINELNESNTYTLEFRMCWPDCFLATTDRPVPALTVESQDFWGATVKLFFSEDVEGFHPRNVGEFNEVDDLRLTGCYLSDWQVPGGIVSNTGTTREVSQDREGNVNVASCPLNIYMLGQNARDGVRIGENDIDWGRRMCVTPDNFRSVEDDCPTKECLEGGCKVEKCTYQVLEVQYTEYNDGVEPVPNAEFAADGRYYDYLNTFRYDGQPVDEHYSFVPLEAWTQARQSVLFRQPHPELGPNVNSEPYLGTLDNQAHKLTLTLDETGYDRTGYNNSFEYEVELRYCGFEDFECGCLPDLNANVGITVGERVWAWGSHGNCLLPEDLNTTSGAEILLPNPNVAGSVAMTVSLKFTEQEVMNYMGAEALAAGYTVIPDFETALLLSVQHCDITNPTDCEAVNITEIIKVGAKSLELGEVFNTTLHIPDIITEKLQVARPDNSTERPLEEMPLGGHFCLTPAHKYTDGVPDTEEAIFFYFNVTEENIGLLAANVTTAPFINRTNGSATWQYGDPAYVQELVANGTVAAEDAFEVGWVNKIFWDGREVAAEYGRQNMAAWTKRVREYILDLGPVDDQPHTLEIVTDVANQLGVEMSELYGRGGPNANNRATVAVDFCDWAPQLDAQAGFQIGNATVLWGTAVCITDEDGDVSHSLSYEECTEGVYEGQMVGSEGSDTEITRQGNLSCETVGTYRNQLNGLHYPEWNLGPQDADATYKVGGWKNVLWYDGEVLTTQLDRPLLAARGNRTVDATNGAGLVVVAPFMDDNVTSMNASDWTHHFQLNLDVDDDVTWALSYNNQWDATVRYCTKVMRESNDRDQCGCTGEMWASPDLQLGSQQLNWGDSVCLGKGDMVTYDPHGYQANYRLYYEERNDHFDSLRKLFPDYRNMILWDGVPIQISEPRYQLQKGEVRSTSWSGGVWLTRDEQWHTLTLDLNTRTDGGLLAPGDPYQVNREVHYDNNVYSLNVTFCELEPDLNANNWLYVRSAIFPWGTPEHPGVACVNASDVAKQLVGWGPALAGSVMYYYGLDVAYFETNSGLTTAEGGWTNHLYWDDMEEPLVVLANRPSLAPGVAREVIHPFEYVVTVEDQVYGGYPLGIFLGTTAGDDFMHRLRVVIDVYNERPENIEPNEFEVEVYFAENQQGYDPELGIAEVMDFIIELANHLLRATRCRYQKPGAIVMNVGITDIKLTVSTEDPAALNTTYIIQVMRYSEPEHALLADLQTTSSTLNPAFDRDVHEYTIVIPATEASVAFIPFNEWDALLLVEGQPVESGTTSHQRPVSLGASITVHLEVIAADGVTRSEYVVVVYRNFAPPPPPLPPPSPSPPPPSPPPPPLEVQASVKLRLRFPSGDAGNLPRDFRQEYQATMDTVQPVALRETLVTQTYAGSVVVESDTTYTSTDGADDFYAAAKCCIADYFAEVDFFDLYGPPELLEGQVVYFVPMPSPKDEYDIAAQGWFWGILCAFVILGALTAAVIQFNKHRAATLLQVQVRLSMTQA